MERRCKKCEALFSDPAEFCPMDGALHAAEAAEPAAAADTAPQARPAAEAHQVPEPEPPPRTAAEAPPEPEPVWPGFNESLETSSRPNFFDVLKARFNRKPADDETAILPPEIVEAGWRIVGPVRTHPAFDRYPVCDAEGSAGVYIRYRTGVLTPAGVYARLLADGGTAPGLARLRRHGTVNHLGIEYPFEITDPVNGELLDDWLRRNGGTEDAIRLLVRALIGLLHDLQVKGFQAITLEPGMLTIQGDRITLTVLGALTPASPITAFHDDIARTTLLASPWTAPEIIQRHVIAPASGEFSAGQITARAQLGEPVHYDTLMNARVPFQKVADPQLARFLMQTLWPDGDERRTVDQMAANPDATLPLWDRLRPGAAENAFPLGGKNYWHAPELMVATVHHWDEARQHLPELMRWLETTPFAAETHTVAACSHRSDDWRLVRLVRLIAPDAPLFWKAHALDDRDVDATLTNLAQRALTGDSAAQADIDALFAADLRGAFTLGNSNAGFASGSRSGATS